MRRWPTCGSDIREEVLALPGTLIRKAEGTGVAPVDPKWFSALGVNALYLVERPRAVALPKRGNRLQASSYLGGPKVGAGGQ